MRKRDFSTRVRLCVVGGAKAGKSAITVRFLTRRFIGEYESNVERSYEGCLEAGNQTINYHLKDCSTESSPSNFLRWASCIAVVYSITDAKSFETASQLLREIHRIEDNDLTTPVVVLMGNKSDLERNRKVPDEKGQRLADEYGVIFCESSAADDYNIFRPLSSLITRSFIESSSHLTNEERVYLLKEMRQPSHVDVAASLIGCPLKDGHDVIENLIDRSTKRWKSYSKGKQESCECERRSHSSSFSSTSSYSPNASPKSSVSMIYPPKSSVSRMFSAPSISRKSTSFPPVASLKSSQSKMSSPKSSLSRLSSAPLLSRKSSSSLSSQSSFSSRYTPSPTSSPSPFSSTSSITSLRSNTPTPSQRSTSPEVISEESLTPQPKRKNSQPYIRKLLREPNSLHLLNNRRKSRSFSDLSTLNYNEMHEESIIGRDRSSTLPFSIADDTSTDYNSARRRSSANTIIKRSFPERRGVVVKDSEECEVPKTLASFQRQQNKDDRHGSKSIKDRLGSIFK